MPELLHLEGMTFGNLTAVCRTGKRGPRHYWKCLCSCGSEHEVSTSKLTTGHTTRCRKCYLESKRLPDHASLIVRLLRTYKKNAKVRGLEWGLTDEQFLALIDKPCFYCGKGVNEDPLTTMKDEWQSMNYMGIDRVDNTASYVPSNVVPCCALCNRAKLTISDGAWRAWLTRIARMYAHPQ